VNARCPRRALVYSSLLAAVEEAGGEEEDGQHERELGVRVGTCVELHNSIDDPGGTSYEPDPGGLSHRWNVGRRAQGFAAENRCSRACTLGIARIRA
jgi:hypothetical protein